MIENDRNFLSFFLSPLQRNASYLYFIIGTDDFGDLVEYIGGDENTFWGAKRIANGHPEPYKLRFIELGNEQYNSRFVEQVL